VESNCVRGFTLKKLIIVVSVAGVCLEVIAYRVNYHIRIRYEFLVV